MMKLNIKKWLGQWIVKSVLIFGTLLLSGCASSVQSSAVDVDSVSRPEIDKKEQRKSFPARVYMHEYTNVYYK
jgi:predicted component of type VI protein secretion system